MTDFPEHVDRRPHQDVTFESILLISLLLLRCLLLKLKITRCELRLQYCQEPHRSSLACHTLRNLIRVVQRTHAYLALNLRNPETSVHSSAQLGARGDQLAVGVRIPACASPPENPSISIRAIIAVE